MHRTSSASLGLMPVTLTIWSFDFLFMRKPTLAWSLFPSECYSRWPLCKVVKHSSGLLTSEIPITFHTNLVALSSSSSSCMCSPLSRVVMLYVAIFSLLTIFRRFFLTHRFLARPARKLQVEQSRLLGHELFRCRWGLGSMAL